LDWTGTQGTQKPISILISPSLYKTCPLEFISLGSGKTAAQRLLAVVSSLRSLPQMLHHRLSQQSQIVD